MLFLFIFSFSIKPAFKGTTKGVRVQCGQPQCGQAIKEGNDPFAVYNQGHNYQQSETIDTRIVGG